ncbi:hypothetical protein M595_5051 [Lyngbya aestuarii BL J]|uniref:Uncharacterized protein n=1 Tax=Lyngbya aestuarii BL J TaxID=1348334 RepID=U7QDD6_9CYAN|nr:hypothetical protein M595_5051 [Lyngbya aestuarii BL J]
MFLYLAPLRPPILGKTQSLKSPKVGGFRGRQYSGVLSTLAVNIQ